MLRCKKVIAIGIAVTKWWCGYCQLNQKIFFFIRPKILYFYTFTTYEILIFCFENIYNATIAMYWGLIFTVGKLCYLLRGGLFCTLKKFWLEEMKEILIVFKTVLLSRLCLFVLILAEFCRSDLRFCIKL